VADETHPPITFTDDEGRHLHATWSRSGKRLILTLTTTQAHTQIELTPEQVEELAEFFSETVRGQHPDR
jgi:hypothetical protein